MFLVVAHGSGGCSPVVTFIRICYMGVAVCSE